MKLSLNIHVFNVEKYIERCLSSIYLQNIKISDFEVIVINDGTEDGSMLIVDKFKKKYSNLTVLNQPNQGLSSARNVGLAIAKGEFIWFVDSDDTILSNCLKEIILLINQCGAEIIAFEFVKVTQGVCVEYSPNKSNKDILFSGIDFLKYYGAGTAWQHLYSRAFLIKYNLVFRVNVFHEDGEFNIRCKTFASRVYYTPKYYYNYTILRKGSIIDQMSFKHVSDLLNHYRFAISFVGQNNFDKKTNKIIYTQACNVIRSSFLQSASLSSDEIIEFYAYIYSNRSDLVHVYLKSDQIKFKILGLALLISPRLFTDFYRKYVILSN